VVKFLVTFTEVVLYFFILVSHCSAKFPGKLSMNLMKECIIQQRRFCFV
jgi:hypothetical protein